jgi:trk system potassium uptake protein TrkH
MLIGTILFIGLGATGFLVIEWDGVLDNLPLGDRLLVSLFHSVTCRTAGFNTVDIAMLTNATLFMSVMLMAVGAGPCSTGGGFKVSTFMLLVLHALSTFQGERRLNLFRRTVPQQAVDRATATAMLFTAVAAIALTILLILEQSEAPHTETMQSFLSALFEVVSALGTVGLSTGITADLSVSGKMVIMLLMFVGRLGPITAFLAISLSERNGDVLHPDEEPLIG